MGREGEERGRGERERREAEERGRVLKYFRLLRSID